MLIGEMKGTLAGVMQMLTQQNITAAALKTDIAENKKELMTFLTKTYDKVEAHVVEDTKVHNTVSQLVTWQQDTSPKVDAMWNQNQRQKGSMITIGAIASVIGGGIVAAVEWFKR